MSGPYDRRGDGRPRRAYPRVVRINSRIVEVLGEAVARIAGDERLGLLTVTAVDTDRDLRHATVYFATLDSSAAAALLEHRGELQAAIARHVRMKRTPQLRFAADPAVAAGQRVEDALSRLRRAR